MEFDQFLTDILHQVWLLEEFGRNDRGLVLVLHLAGFAVLDLEHLVNEGLLAVEGPERLSELAGRKLCVDVGLGQPVDERV